MPEPKNCISAPQFAGLKILKLEDILKRFPRQAILNIHIKSIGKEPYPRDKFRKMLEMGIDTILINDYFRISQVRDAFVKKIQ